MSPAASMSPASTRVGADVMVADDGGFVSDGDSMSFEDDEEGKMESRTMSDAYRNFRKVRGQLLDLHRESVRLVRGRPTTADIQIYRPPENTTERPHRVYVDEDFVFSPILRNPKDRLAAPKDEVSVPGESIEEDELPQHQLSKNTLPDAIPERQDEDILSQHRHHNYMLPDTIQEHDDEDASHAEFTSPPRHADADFVSSPEEAPSSDADSSSADEGETSPRREYDDDEFASAREAASPSAGDDETEFASAREESDPEPVAPHAIGRVASESELRGDRTRDARPASPQFDETDRSSVPAESVPTPVIVDPPTPRTSPRKSEESPPRDDETESEQFASVRGDPQVIESEDDTPQDQAESEHFTSVGEDAEDIDSESETYESYEAPSEPFHEVIDEIPLEESEVARPRSSAILPLAALPTFSRTDFLAALESSSCDAKSAADASRTEHAPALDDPPGVLAATLGIEMVTEAPDGDHSEKAGHLMGCSEEDFVNVSVNVPESSSGDEISVGSQVPDAKEADASESTSFVDPIKDPLEMLAATSGIEMVTEAPNGGYAGKAGLSGYAEEFVSIPVAVSESASGDEVLISIPSDDGDNSYGGILQLAFSESGVELVVGGDDESEEDDGEDQVPSEGTADQTNDLDAAEPAPQNNSQQEVESGAGLATPAPGANAHAYSESESDVKKVVGGNEDSIEREHENEEHQALSECAVDETHGIDQIEPTQADNSRQIDESEASTAAPTPGSSRDELLSIANPMTNVDGAGATLGGEIIHEPSETRIESDSQELKTEVDYDKSERLRWAAKAPEAAEENRENDEAHTGQAHGTIFEDECLSQNDLDLPRDKSSLDLLSVGVEATFPVDVLGDDVAQNESSLPAKGESILEWKLLSTRSSFGSASIDSKAEFPNIPEASGASDENEAESIVSVDVGDTIAQPAQDLEGEAASLLNTANNSEVDSEEFVVIDPSVDAYDKWLAYQDKVKESHGDGDHNDLLDATRRELLGSDDGDESIETSREPAIHQRNDSMLNLDDNNFDDDMDQSIQTGRKPAAHEQDDETVEAVVYDKVEEEENVFEESNELPGTNLEELKKSDDIDGDVSEQKQTTGPGIDTAEDSIGGEYIDLSEPTENNSAKYKADKIDGADLVAANGTVNSNLSDDDPVMLERRIIWQMLAEDEYSDSDSSDDFSLSHFPAPPSAKKADAKIECRLAEDTETGDILVTLLNASPSMSGAGPLAATQSGKQQAEQESDTPQTADLSILSVSPALHRKATNEPTSTNYSPAVPMNSTLVAYATSQVNNFPNRDRPGSGEIEESGELPSLSTRIPKTKEADRSSDIMSPFMELVKQHSELSESKSQSRFYSSTDERSSIASPIDNKRSARLNRILMEALENADEIKASVGATTNAERSSASLQDTLNYSIEESQKGEAQIDAVSLDDLAAVAYLPQDVESANAAPSVSDSDSESLHTSPARDDKTKSGESFADGSVISGLTLSPGTPARPVRRIVQLQNTHRPEPMRRNRIMRPRMSSGSLLGLAAPGSVFRPPSKVGQDPPAARAHRDDQYRRSLANCSRSSVSSEVTSASNQRRISPNSKYERARSFTRSIGSVRSTTSPDKAPYLFTEERSGRLRRTSGESVSPSRVSSSTNRFSSSETHRSDVAKRRQQATQCAGSKYDAHVHGHGDACYQCWTLASSADRRKFVTRGSSLCITKTKGGCSCKSDCKIFSEEEIGGKVHLCRKCYFDTHSEKKSHLQRYRGNYKKIDP